MVLHSYYYYYHYKEMWTLLLHAPGNQNIHVTCFTAIIRFTSKGLEWDPHCLRSSYRYWSLLWVLLLWRALNNTEVQQTLFNTLLFSGSVVSDYLWPHGLQQARLPCPSPTPRACLNSCKLNRWSTQPSHPLSSPSPPTFNPSASGPFLTSRLFSSSGQSIGDSASASVLPMSIQDFNT